MTIRGIKATWQCKVCLTEIVIESNLKTTQGILELLRGHENNCTDGLPLPPPLQDDPNIIERFGRAP
jgi:hypothetical protein